MSICKHGPWAAANIGMEEGVLVCGCQCVACGKTVILKEVPETIEEFKDKALKSNK